MLLSGARARASHRLIRRPRAEQDRGVVRGLIRLGLVDPKDSQENIRLQQDVAVRVGSTIIQCVSSWDNHLIVDFAVVGGQLNFQ